MTEGAAAPVNGAGAAVRALEARLAALQHEYRTGEQRMAALRTDHRSTRDTLLRISGAIQVLQEVIAALRAAVRDDGGAVEGGDRSPVPAGQA